MFGKYCVIRSGKAGVFAGILTEKNGQEVRMKDCRRIWYWEGAASISQIANEGVKAPKDCKFSVSVSDITIMDVIEIIPCTEKAEKNIREVPEWRI